MQLVEYGVPPQSVHFEWLQEGQRLGCSLDQPHSVKFKEIVCRLIADVAARHNQDNSYLSYCKVLQQQPEYQPLKASSSSMTDEDLSDVLYKQAKLDSTMVAHTGRLFEVVGGEAQPRYPVVLTVKSYGEFRYSLAVFDRKNSLLLEKPITADMNYSLDYEECSLRWVHPSANG